MDPDTAQAGPDRDALAKDSKEKIHENSVSWPPPIDGFAVVRDVQGRLLRVVHEPEDDRVHIHRDRVFRQCLLGTKRRGLNPLIDHGLRRGR